MTLTIIGSGNVATHLALAFKRSGVVINQIFSRNLLNAQALASKVDAEAISDLALLKTNSDFYLIAVSDNAISSIVEEMKPVSGIVAHTAGSVPISLLGKFISYGSFYPFQTFTKEREIDIKDVPFFIEGNSPETEQQLYDIASLISNRVDKVDEKKRFVLHLSGVFACNFVNHLYAVSQDILEESGLDFSYIEPLINETMRKAIDVKPYSAQTGPARRNDTNVMQFHIDKLKENKSHHDLYKLISESIIKMYYKREEDKKIMRTLE